MKDRAPLVAATLEVWSTNRQIRDRDRWYPAFYEPRFIKNERALKKLRSVPLGNFIPEELPDGSKGITYGQVGARKLNPRGSVRYLQVINIRDTGIDFAVKPDRIVEGSHNDPERSRVQQGDILLTNTAFRGTETLMGRCVAVSRDYGKLNISQDIDRIRVQGINPFFVCAFLKTKFGQLQIQRLVHGVDSQKINFGQVRSLLIPVLSESVQSEVEKQYCGISKCHDKGMAIKEEIQVSDGIDAGRFGEAINELANESQRYKSAVTEAQERLKHLLAELGALLDGKQKKIRPFAG